MIFKNNSKFLKTQWQIKERTLKFYIKIIMVINIKLCLKDFNQKKIYIRVKGI